MCSEQHTLPLDVSLTTLKNQLITDKKHPYKVIFITKPSLIINGLRGGAQC
jgi:hypothetical protein